MHPERKFTGLLSVGNGHVQKQSTELQYLPVGAILEFMQFILINVIC